MGKVRHCKLKGSGFNPTDVCAPLLHSPMVKRLVTRRGGGGLQNGRGGGGHVKFNPYKKGGGGSFSHAEGGGTTSFGVVFMR